MHAMPHLASQGPGVTQIAIGLSEWELFPLLHE